MRREPPPEFINLGLHAFPQTARFQRLVYPVVRYDKCEHLTSAYEARAIEVLFAQPRVVHIRQRMVRPGMLRAVQP